MTHNSSEPALTAGHFQGAVWNMPEGPSSSSSGKQKGKGKLEEKREVEYYTRACRIKVKSRATLIVCPLSTVVNWEDQFKEHWGGEVCVVGGANGTYTTPQKKAGARGLKVYVYHGNARHQSPYFLSDFDAVITTFATLASEFSKQSKSGDDGDDEESDGDMTMVEENGQMVASNGGSMGMKKGKNKKRKKGGPALDSPLQMVHWFRVVLDEAQYVWFIFLLSRLCLLTAGKFYQRDNYSWQSRFM
jgi:SNF2 family DNA or RNA helicase